MSMRPIALVLLLGGCTAAAGGWGKTGADAAATASAYQDCRGLATGAVKTQADIDQDIIASRHDDRQRAGIVRIDTQNRQAETTDRATAIIAACMRAKGFAPAAKPAG